MSEQPIDNLIHELRERAKELNCLYEVQELLRNTEGSLKEICESIVKVMPPGWQYPDVCQAQITYGNQVYQTTGYRNTKWIQQSDIVVQSAVVGTVSICYTEERPPADEGPFLSEERRLIDTIAEQLGFFIFNKQLRQVFQEKTRPAEEATRDIGVIIDLLQRAEPALLVRLARKMVNYLGWQGIAKAEQILTRFGPALRPDGGLDDNRPSKHTNGSFLDVADEVFKIASKHLPRDTILENIQHWIKEDRIGFLINVLVNPGSSIADINSAIEKYQLLAAQGVEIASVREKWFSISLIRRILSDKPHFIDTAKKYIQIDHFVDFMRRIVYPANSHGQLGGKSSGLFLAAQILRNKGSDNKLLQNVRTPKTWYLTSDTVFYFISYNNLEDVVEQKYKHLDQIKQEYPFIVQLFKNSPLPPEIVKGLSLALDDFRDVPLVVRSSSLLEDQSGAAFAGKYKSLFIANKGEKDERLESLMDAIKEVYASLFSPDPIEYRYEHGFLDHHEEMGILIQEVVGKQVGHYYLPAYAGVAFSNNEFRWSSRIKRQDGLVRIVPGLGTRSVDRLSDDYPALVSPGQPGLRVNATPDEVLHFSPKKVDLVNLESRSFETVDIVDLLKGYGNEYPQINQLISIYQEGHIQQFNTLGIDFNKGNFVVTFEGLFARTSFLKQIRAILDCLEEALGYPVDIEFAHDGKDFYLLQCRAQSYRIDSMPILLPATPVSEKILFTAEKYISNGIVNRITHIVYVDPIKYSELRDYQSLTAIGKIVGRLNQALPKRRFILMGPGRWGSRGDIKLGVSVTYSDINNTAMLIEIARRKKDYLPELSFGTHFFQDLVEASIRYLPLYPDDPGIVFNQDFLTKQPNILNELVQDSSAFADVVRVIDIPACTDGLELTVLMSADDEKALGYFTSPDDMHH